MTLASAKERCKRNSLAASYFSLTSLGLRSLRSLRFIPVQNWWMRSTKVCRVLMCGHMTCDEATGHPLLQCQEGAEQLRCKARGLDADVSPSLRDFFEACSWRERLGHEKKYKEMNRNDLTLLLMNLNECLVRYEYILPTELARPHGVSERTPAWSPRILGKSPSLGQEELAARLQSIMQCFEGAVTSFRAQSW